jgi:hypothetical protein
MGFAWMPDEGADARDELHRDDHRAAGRYYRSSPRAALRSQAGRHAMNHSQRTRGAGRGAHAARPASVPRRPSGWSGPERWRRWA